MAEEPRTASMGTTTSSLVRGNSLGTVALKDSACGIRERNSAVLDLRELCLVSHGIVERVPIAVQPCLLEEQHVLGNDTHFSAPSCVSMAVPSERLR
jgi:hypothetical protein